MSLFSVGFWPIDQEDTLPKVISTCRAREHKNGDITNVSKPMSYNENGLSFYRLRRENRVLDNVHEYNDEYRPQEKSEYKSIYVILDYVLDPIQTMKKMPSRCL